MATLDDGRARQLAGQAERLRNDARRAADYLGRGMVDEALALVRENASYAHVIWHELHLLTEPQRDIPIRGKSRRR